jgi:hypothetical protein
MSTYLSISIYLSIYLHIFYLYPISFPLSLALALPCSPCFSLSLYLSIYIYLSISIYLSTIYLYFFLSFYHFDNFYGLRTGFRNKEHPTEVDSVFYNEKGFIPSSTRKSYSTFVSVHAIYSFASGGRKDLEEGYGTYGIPYMFEIIRNSGLRAFNNRFRQI